MNDAIQQIRARKATEEDQYLKAVMHQQELDASGVTQHVIIESFRSLIGYLDNKVTKTELTNQLTNIGTPDVIHVVNAVNDLHDTLKGHKDTDLTEVTSLLQGVLTQLEAVPKDHQPIDIPTEVTIKNQPDWKPELTKLLEAIQAIKLTAEAPQVHVPAPNVHVDAPDLSSLETGLKSVEKAVKAVKLEQVVEATKAQTLVGEAFDEYRIIYASDGFDDDREQVQRIDYFMAGKKVSSIVYKYDSSGNVLSGKRTK